MLGTTCVSALMMSLLSAFYQWDLLQLPLEIFSVIFQWQSLTLCDPMGLQHARLPCPSPSPGVCSNLGPLNQRCYLTISSSVTPFSSCPQSFPTSESFPMSPLFASGEQYWRFSFSISPSNKYGLHNFQGSVKNKNS